MLAILALVVAVPVLAVLGLGASTGPGGYEVRAIFDNVAAAVPGEDVKVAGAKVGVIESMSVTPDNKAAVVLKIQDTGFSPFRTDARCTVRPQSLIGEKFVECEPGTSSHPVLDRIEKGAGKGQHLLPVTSTSSPVDLDVVNDTLRLPYRERLAILLGEFGTGLAGKGQQLNQVIHRANPALQQTDRVLAILAGQNRTLAKLARDSDTALAPLARQKQRVADFIVRANDTAQATAERRQDIAGGIQRLPRFLSTLRPFMADLGNTADQTTPVLTDLHRAAPDLSRLIQQLGPFSTAARPAIRAVGRATVRGRPALLRTAPLFKDLRRFGKSGRPVSTNLDRLTASLDKTGGIERIMDYLFFQMTAINGFDGIGHYLRAALIVNTCSVYSVKPINGCNSNFTDTNASSASAGGKRLKASLAENPRVRSVKPGTRRGGSVAPNPLQELLGGGVTQQGRSNIERVQKQAGQASPGLKNTDEPLMDYLLGNGP